MQKWPTWLLKIFCASQIWLSMLTWRIKNFNCLAKGMLKNVHRFVYLANSNNSTLAKRNPLKDFLHFHNSPIKISQKEYQILSKATLKIEITLIEVSRCDHCVRWKTWKRMDWRIKHIEKACKNLKRKERTIEIYKCYLRLCNRKHVLYCIDFTKYWWKTKLH